MKSTRFSAVIVVLLGLLIVACGGVSVPLTVEAPAIFPTSPPQAPVAGGPTVTIPVDRNPQTPADVAGLQNVYEAIYEKVSPSVVTIEIGSRASGSSGNGQQNNQGQIVPVALGSGFVLDSAGHIVTNNHVVEGADRITVTFSAGSSYDAQLVGRDPNTDLAVIQVLNAPASLIKPITVGDSSQVKVGQMVVAIGNPFGLANTMTTGIVSAISRSIPAGVVSGQNGSTSGASFSIPDIIQTDAAINPGNSGGVLVDMSGNLIGVPSQIESPSGSNAGVGFAIPSAIVVQVAPQLIANGRAVHPYLGISGVTITPDIASALNLKPGQQGILVATVVPGGPADQAARRKRCCHEHSPSGTPAFFSMIESGQKLVKALCARLKPTKIASTIQYGWT